MRDHLDAAISRRTALAAVAVAGAAATLAACSTSGSPNTPLRTGGNHAGGDGDGDGDGDSGAPSGAPSASGGDVVVALSKVPMGSATTAKLSDGSKVFVSRPDASSANCFSRICTHQGCTVNPPTSSDPKELHCPCHGSIYNALTGAVIKGPAPKALPKVAVKVRDGNVVTS